METKKSKLVASATVIFLLILALIILYLTLGPCKTFFILTSVDIFSILAILLCFTLSRWKPSMICRSVVEGEEELRIEYSYLRKVAGLPKKFRYETLQAATDDFRSLIGQGSSASVFKGVLNDGTLVAVKRIEGSEHGERVFRSEVAAIASVQHVNLVRLTGYCLVPRTSARLLVYEYVHNGSLDKWIFSERESKFLPWSVRYNVAVDVARALAYLHNDCRSKVLHLDVKPENILLDERFRAMVSDFGLSKMMGKDESRIVTTVRGTRGYLAPEWFVGRGVSEKCDVFSYGMVLLELVCGRRSMRLVGEAVQRAWSYLPMIVVEKVNQGKLMEVVDERLIDGGGGVKEREVRTLVYVALWCIREEAKLRPSMAEVVEMLQGKVGVEAPPVETEMLILNFLTMEHATTQDGDRGIGTVAVAASPRLHQLESQHGSIQYSIATTILSGR